MPDQDLPPQTEAELWRRRAERLQVRLADAQVALAEAWSKIRALEAVVHPRPVQHRPLQFQPGTVPAPSPWPQS